MTTEKKKPARRKLLQIAALSTGAALTHCSTAVGVSADTGAQDADAASDDVVGDAGTTIDDADGVFVVDAGTSPQDGGTE